VHQIDPEITTLHRFGQLWERVQITQAPLGTRSAGLRLDHTGAAGQRTEIKLIGKVLAQMRPDKTTGTRHCDTSAMRWSRHDHSVTLPVDEAELKRGLLLEFVCK
jgi:hypothetical protein